MGTQKGFRRFTSHLKSIAAHMFLLIIDTKCQQVSTPKHRENKLFCLWVRWHRQGTVGVLCVMIMEVLQWWCPVRQMFTFTAFSEQLMDHLSKQHLQYISGTCRLCQLCLQKVFFCNRQTLSRQPWVWAKNPVAVFDLEFNSYFNASYTHATDKFSFPPFFRRQSKIYFSSLSDPISSFSLASAAHGFL